MVLFSLFCCRLIRFILLDTSCLNNPEILHFTIKYGVYFNIALLPFSSWGRTFILLGCGGFLWVSAEFYEGVHHFCISWASYGLSFFFYFLIFVNCIDIFSNKPLYDEPHLVMIYFYVFVDPFHKYFIEEFCIYINRSECLYFLFWQYSFFVIKNWLPI